MDRHYGAHVSPFQVAAPEMPQPDLIEAASQGAECRSHGCRPVALGW